MSNLSPERIAEAKQILAVEGFLPTPYANALFAALTSTQQELQTVKEALEKNKNWELELNRDNLRLRAELQQQTATAERAEADLIEANSHCRKVNGQIEEAGDAIEEILGSECEWDGVAKTIRMIGAKLTEASAEIGSSHTTSARLQMLASFRDFIYRQAFVKERVRTSVALQIRALRLQRNNMSQKQLGEAIGMAQTWISKLENPDYGKMTVATLLRLAEAFDTDLEIKFRPFSTTIDTLPRQRSDYFVVPSFTDEFEGDSQSRAGTIVNVPPYTSGMIIKDGQRYDPLPQPDHGFRPVAISEALTASKGPEQSAGPQKITEACSPGKHFFGQYGLAGPSDFHTPCKRCGRTIQALASGEKG